MSRLWESLFSNVSDLPFFHPGPHPIKHCQLPSVGLWLHYLIISLLESFACPKKPQIRPSLYYSGLLSVTKKKEFHCIRKVSLPGGFSASLLSPTIISPSGSPFNPTAISFSFVFLCACNVSYRKDSPWLDLPVIMPSCVLWEDVTTWSTFYNPVMVAILPNSNGLQTATRHSWIFLRRSCHTFFLWT